MTCFEARQGFVAFWQRIMEPEQRASLSAHLRTCQRCDQSFRVFALTAPVLHSRGEPMVEAVRAQPRLVARAGRRVGETAPARGGFGGRSWWMIGAMGAMAAAVFAAYIETAGPSSALALEQTIAGEDSGIELTSFTAGGGLLGADSTGQDTNRSLPQEPRVNHSDDLAG